jgi:hypothetical protein
MIPSAGLFQRLVLPARALKSEVNNGAPCRHFDDRLMVAVWSGDA